MGRSSRKTRLFAITIFTVNTLLACGRSTSTNVMTPAPTRCQPTLTNSTESFGPTGGTGTLSVGVSRECTWSASSQASWITLTSGQEGQGDGTVSYKVGANGDPVTRRGAIAINDQQAQLSQDAAPCLFRVVPSGQSIPATGGQMPVDVQTNALCSWTASSESAFASVAPGSGRGNAVVNVTIASNTGAVRSASVVIAGQRVAITQPAPTQSPAPAPTPNPAPNPPAPGPAPAPPAPTPTPSPIRTVELDGTIDSVTGSCPALSFVMARRTILVTSDTTFSKGSCKKLDRGAEVTVEGRQMSDGTIAADRVTFNK